MKALNQFIVKPLNDTRYSNTKNIAGVDFIVNTSEEDHKFSNRFAKVVETPLGYSGPISIGDILVVHHNVFKFYNDIKGRRKSGRSYLKDDLFLIDFEQFFLYKKHDKWISHDRYCFIKPIPATDSFIKKPFSLEPLMGTMVYPSEYLISKGIVSGDLVCFTPGGEYEFEIDGDKMYRMFESMVTIKLN